ncbi:helix-turn-helix domain-containing protein [Anatilimnocola floriformis]|uniref:helix-turn-helix domain-containing protein n=1 Tax=Anatilimnocola floriformis TaxID=2948575 RepID=UPI0036F2A6EB
MPIATPALDQIRLDASTRQLFELLPDVCFFIKDKAGRLIHCNEVHRRGIFRYGNADDLYGKANHDFFPNALANSFAEDDQRVIQHGDSILEQCELNITSAGALSWFCTTKVPARDRHGKIVGLVGISRRLESADHRMGNFELLSAALDHIQKNFSQQICVQTLADACQLTEATFRREFEKLFRMTPLQFILRLRLHEACLRLSANSDSIGDIAYQCGFDDQNYFARYFKRAMSMTPSEFRERQNPRQNSTRSQSSQTKS